ncbi:hypothetical protein [Acaryochloris sp. CCMEE 5410]|uniref:hypothetical protein n=1 Tax=Acaryochloris sp. CCMEE 5410 TaxID=310037 RepID=UPI0002484D15|nr:hypothetical protein [Acaryochloris sp. CCMEE 5410]KAI9133545.1 hypothetical protein ON05_009675 [Acaryochloris sp. CCMEE 5410]
MHPVKPTRVSPAEPGAYQYLVIALFKAFAKDSKYAELFKDDKIKNLLSRQKNLEAATKNASENDSAKSKNETIETKQPNEDLQTSALAIAAKEVSEGWIYLGHTAEPGTEILLPRTKTIEVTGLPKNGDELRAITNINFRNNSPAITGKLGDIIGVIKKGERVKILEVNKSTSTAKGYDAYWARIKLLTE